MPLKDGVIEFICEGGTGSEANVTVELRTKFPGIGGTVVTDEGVATAVRQDHSPMPRAAHRTFLRHAIIKKLEDFFHRSGEYVYAHIPRPLGSLSRVGESACEAYLYEWTFGSSGFPWQYVTREGEQANVVLRDWDRFVEVFHNAGIDMKRDCADAEDGRISQNIVHEMPIGVGYSQELNCLWKRIDFGVRSLPIDYERLHRFLTDREGELRRTLRTERYEMMVLAWEYLTNGEQMDRLAIGRLDALVGDYRLSSLRHRIARGVGAAESPVARMEPGLESLA